jgi:hypothetical protein
MVYLLVDILLPREAGLVFVSILLNNMHPIHRLEVVEPMPQLELVYGMLLVSSSDAARAQFITT